MSASDPHQSVIEATESLVAASAALASPKDRARVLEAMAAALDGARAEIIQTAADETALYPQELEPEFDRMSGTLRMFAALVRDGSWVRASIDAPLPAGQKSIGPNHDIRRMLVPLGPVAVFGASNFPLAYGVCGGDTASALAAGCPVVVKEHPAHPKTGRLIYRLANRAANQVGCRGVLGYLIHQDPRDHSVAKALVQHRSIRGVGFTGSTKGGLAIHNLATTRTWSDGSPDPIPAYSEMGSCNVIIIMRHAFDAGRERIADEIANSLLARVGQQCTAPSVLLVAGYERADWMYDALKRRIAQAQPRRMLSGDVAANYYRRLDEVAADTAVEASTALPTREQRDANLGVPVLFKSQAVKLENTPVMWDEIFGPGLVVAGCGAMASGYMFLPHALTGTIYADPEDNSSDGDSLLDEAFLGTSTEVAAWMSNRVGRLVINGVTTGVRVCDSMVHGGPFPATNRPDTTAVGPLAIERWCRPVCFQNCPDALLPPELQDANPMGIWRTVNGTPTRQRLTGPKKSA